MEDGQPGDVYDDDEEEEAEPPVREAPTKRSKPVQAATASEPAKKRQKTAFPSFLAWRTRARVRTISHTTL